IQSECTERIKQARDLDARALKAWDQAEGSQNEAEHELAVLKDDVGDIKKVVDKNDPEIPKLDQAAQGAYAARNQRVLTDARLKLIDFQKPGLRVPLLRDKVSKFLKKYHYHDLTTEAQYLVDDLQRIDDSMKKLDAIVQRLVGLGQV